MTWNQWVQAVLAIGKARNLSVRYEPAGTANGVFFADSETLPWHFIGGAGASMMPWTTPEQFTFLWPFSPEMILVASPQSESWRRRGRYVPRIPARAVEAALRRVFLA